MNGAPCPSNCRIGSYNKDTWRVSYLVSFWYVITPLLIKVTNNIQGRDILRNARKEANLINPDTGDYFELDVYIPSLSLAIEYHVIMCFSLAHSTLTQHIYFHLQEKHHYISSTEYTYQPLQHYQHMDALKRKLAEDNGITIITVPFWWDKQKDRYQHSLLHDNTPSHS